MIGDLRSGSWLVVVRQTAREVAADGCFGLAAQLSFYFLLALFPALLFLVALIGYVPVEDAIEELLTTLGTVSPQVFARNGGEATAPELYSQQFSWVQLIYGLQGIPGWSGRHPHRFLTWRTQLAESH